MILRGIRCHRGLTGLVLVLAVGLVGGCGLDPAPTALPALPTLTPGTTPPIAAPFVESQAPEASRGEQATFRVRNVMCGVGVATGSGFPIDSHLLVTNRHVVDGASVLQLNRWDGVDIDVSTAGVAFVADLALVRTVDALPIVLPLAAADPSVGDTVQAIGYPFGGPLTVTSGRVIGRDVDPDEGFPVLVTSVPVQHGNSGGPLLDAAGVVVGVVYALNTRTGDSYAIPVSVLRNVAGDTGALRAIPPC